MSGGFRVRFGDWRFALTSPYRLLIWGFAIGLVRHAIAPRPAIYRDLPRRLTLAVPDTVGASRRDGVRGHASRHPVCRLPRGLRVRLSRTRRAVEDRRERIRESAGAVGHRLVPRGGHRRIQLRPGASGRSAEHRVLSGVSAADARRGTAARRRIDGISFRRHAHFPRRVFLGAHVSLSLRARYARRPGRRPEPPSGSSLRIRSRSSSAPSIRNRCTSSA